MKNILIIGFTAILSVNGFAIAETNAYTASFNLSSVKSIYTDSAGEFYVVSVDGQTGMTEIPGCPELPVKELTFVVPQSAAGIKVVVTSWHASDVSGNFMIYPAQPPMPLNGSAEPAFFPPDSEMYASATPFPVKMAEVVRVSAMGEYKLVTVRLYPVRYFPLARKLQLFSQISLSLDYSIDLSMRLLVAKKYSGLEDPMRTVVMKSAANPQCLDGIDLLQHDPSQAMPKDGGIIPPSTSRIDYLIITSEALADQFGRLADWRTRTGFLTRIQTVEWIRDNVPGSDLQEKVRNYIKSCWLFCGTSYVLLGGDTDIIPVRELYYVDYYIPGSNLPSDLYYSDIVDTSFGRGFWDYDYNANKNSRYGEIPSNCGQDDAVDQTPDLLLGRAPVATAAQAESFISKVLSYEQNPPPGFAESVLMLADGNFAWFTEQADLILAANAPWIDSYEMYNPVSSSYFAGDEMLTPSSACAELSQGYNIVYHFDHGGLYALSMAKDHASTGGGWIYRPHADALTNAGRTSIMITPACSPNAFDHNCFSEHLMNNPNGGAVAFIGNSRVGWTSQYGQFNQFFNALYGLGLHSLGACFNEMVKAGNCYSRYSLNLLGDPALQVYTREPQALLVEHPRKLGVSDSIITISVNTASYGTTSATVCLYKSGELNEVRQVPVPGTTSIPVPAVTSGALLITVTAPNCLPYQDSCRVQQMAATYPSILGCRIVDGDVALIDGSIGNGDSIANPGETVAIYPSIDSPYGYSMKLGSSDQFITVIDSLIPVGGTINSYNNDKQPVRFLAKISTQVPGDHQASLNISIKEICGTRVYNYPFSIPVAIDSLALISATFRSGVFSSNEMGAIIIDSIRVANQGCGAAKGVKLWIDMPSDSNGSCYFTGDTLRIGDIPAGNASALCGSLSFRCYANQLDTLTIPLIIEDAYGRRRNILLPYLHRTDCPYGLSAVPISDRAIRVEWQDSISNAIGYNLYRKDTAGAGYFKVNLLPVFSRFYIDENLKPLTSYSYAVATVYSNGVEGQLSAAESGSTSPALCQGFPVELGIGNTGSRIWSSPAVGDIDGDGGKEIVLGCDDGYVYVLNDRGNPLPGWPKDLGSGMVIENSSPTLVDLDGDGCKEIIMGNGPWWGGVGDCQVHVWKFDGTDLPGWPQLVYGDAFGAISVADIDNDGFPEVVSTTTLGNVYAWNRTGQLLPGWPVSAGTRIATSAAIGNMDGDPELEIVVVASNSGYLRVSVLNPDGTFNPGWPQDVQTCAVQVQSSPALGDMDGDGVMEIIFGAEPDQTGMSNVYCLRSDGTNLPGWPLGLAYNTRILSSPAIGDIDGDGGLDVAIASGDGVLYSISHRTAPVVNWSRNVPPNGRCSPIIGDIDADNRMEVVASTEEGYLWSFNGEDGTDTPGFPLFIEPSWSAPLLTDLDSDGKLNLIAFGWGSHKIFAWDALTTDRPEAVEWSQLSCDQGRTGCYISAAKRALASTGSIASTVSRGHLFTCSLEPCRPNPSKGPVSINFQTAKQGQVSIKVYNLLGQTVRTLVSGFQPAGSHQVQWNGCNESGSRTASGTYLCKLTSGSFSSTRKIVILN